MPQPSQYADYTILASVTYMDYNILLKYIWISFILLTKLINNIDQ